uniref:ribose-phosphate diphosphokinase n=1 Tax=Sexangularia sp. CB-2014 TaxID=1486929 RepID=A0A7S1VST8_9EUKA|mmetsp:Transcript_848/g.2572  ORF Transcript_848/g.2572 Transcript_848/m.2572 type:complete len:354 (+) Transcript_848:36-1097(+)
MSKVARTAERDEGSYTIRLIAGSANKELAESVANLLAHQLEDVSVGRFADGEIKIHIHNNVRGADVYILQPTCPPVNDNMMELLFMLHTLNLSSARRITAVLPYYGYARQDRKERARTPISAAAVASLIETMGPHRVVTLDLHCGQIQGFFRNVPVDNLFAENEFLERVYSLGLDPTALVIVSPDAGGVSRARRVADKCGAYGVVTILKRRVTAGQVDSMQLVGDVEGKVAIIWDDIIDTAGTICKAAGLLKEAGATKVYGCATHGVLSGPALERISKSEMEEVWVSDSIPQGDNAQVCKKLQVVSIAPLLAEAIHRLHNEESLSRLFTTSHSVRKQEALEGRASTPLKRPRK